MTDVCAGLCLTSNVTCRACLAYISVSLETDISSRADDVVVGGFFHDEAILFKLLHPHDVEPIQVSDRVNTIEGDVLPQRRVIASIVVRAAE